MRVMDAPDVIVVGGGASGMAAAIAAARRGVAATVVERNPRVGRKLLATGNGRCNLSNAHLELSRYHGADPAFAGPALSRFGLEETLSFFSAMGIEPREQEGGKIFPRSGQASSVLDVLRHEMSRLGVTELVGTRVTGLARARGSWIVRTGPSSLGCRAVVLATGGRAAPQLGSDGSGYGLAAALGHRIVDPFPALTRLRVRSPWLGHLKGVKVEVSAAVLADGRRLREAEGELLFTERGLSGPPILDLSRIAAERLRGGERVHVSIDLCPEIAADELPGLLLRRLRARAGSTSEFALVGFLHKRLAGPVLAEAGLDPRAPAESAVPATAERLSGTLKRWSLEVTGSDSWTDAQVTAGGIDVRDVDPVTLESRLAPGVFFAGELLDVDGDCGGFNLQWAWSSGLAAGTAAAVRALATGRVRR